MYGSWPGHTMSVTNGDPTAKWITDRCREKGVTLLASGTGVHALPTRSLNAHVGLLRLVRNYRRDIMVYLDGLVE